MEIVGVLSEKINLIFGIFAGIMATIFGDWWWAIAAFAALNVADFVTGCWKARTLGKESSEKGAIGIAKKFCYWIVIGLAFLVSSVFAEVGGVFNVDLGFAQFIGWFTLASYGINEIRSILENVVAIQGEKTIIPSFLIKGLDVAQKFLKDKENQ